MEYWQYIMRFWEIKQTQGLSFEKEIPNESINEYNNCLLALNNVQRPELDLAITGMVNFLIQLEDLTDFRKRTIGLSLNQGLAYENYLFVKIRNEIIWAAQLAGLSESQVVFFYTEDPLDSYSKPALHNIIMECRKELTIQMVNTDYLKFASIIETLIKEIILLRNKSEELYL